MEQFLPFLFFLLTMLSYWLIFKKMGYEGWQGVIPFYNIYVLSKTFYGNGWWCLLLFIPLANLIFYLKLCHDLGEAFGKGIFFSLGLAFLHAFFIAILAFGDAHYQGYHS